MKYREVQWKYRYSQLQVRVQRNIGRVTVKNRYRSCGRGQV
jgi:hypothetical protein